MSHKPAILIVDDRVENLVLLEKVLRPFDVDFVRACSGNEALTLTLEHDFALALVDVQMPEMDGYEMVQLMRQNDATRLLPVIFVSAIVSEDFYKDKGAHAGAVDFMSKPIIPVVMRAKVRVFLDLYQQRIALERANVDLKTMQGQLIQSEKLASIGQLAAGLAHEINTPVGYVASNIQALTGYTDKIQQVLSRSNELIHQRRELDHAAMIEKIDQMHEMRNQLKIDFILEDVQDLFRDCREGLEKIGLIVQSLRDFSRIDQLDAYAMYNLNDGITTTLAVVGHELETTARVETDLGNIPEHMCHAGLMNQALLNIIVNAIQAIQSQQRTEPGTIVIQTSNDLDGIVCRISDDGPGIPPEIIPKVCDPFFTTKPVGEGPGLGLNIAYDIITNKHGGVLMVDSTVGKGTTITIKLPPCTGETTPVQTQHVLIGQDDEG